MFGVRWREALEVGLRSDGRVWLRGGLSAGTRRIGGSRLGHNLLMLRRGTGWMRGSGQGRLSTTALDQYISWDGFERTWVGWEEGSHSSLSPSETVNQKCNPNLYPSISSIWRWIDIKLWLRRFRIDRYSLKFCLVVPHLEMRGKMEQPSFPEEDFDSDSELDMKN